MHTFRDRPFNLKGVRIFFFCHPKPNFFFQNSTLGYMTKTLNQIIFFSSTKIRIFFSATLGIRIFFQKKNITLPFKLNGRSLSICTLNTLQNITKTLAQNYREGQTGVKQYALVQGYTLTVMFHSYMYVKHIIMVWFLFVRHSILVYANVRRPIIIKYKDQYGKSAKFRNKSVLVGQNMYMHMYFVNDSTG